MRRKFAGSREFDWHPEARVEEGRLKAARKRLWGALVQRIRTLVTRDGDSWGQPGVGRIWSSAILEPPGLFLLYVHRRDTHGLGGLLVHHNDQNPGETIGPGCTPPNDAFELAQFRLNEMETW